MQYRKYLLFLKDVSIYMAVTIIKWNILDIYNSTCCVTSLHYSRIYDLIAIRNLYYVIFVLLLSRFSDVKVLGLSLQIIQLLDGWKVHKLKHQWIQIYSTVLIMWYIFTDSVVRKRKQRLFQSHWITFLHSIMPAPGKEKNDKKSSELSTSLS